MTARYAYNKGRNWLATRGKRRRTKYASRAKRARRIGNPVGRSGTKRYQQVDASTLQRATRTLYSNNLAEIPHDVDNNIDSRQRDMVNLRGIKICFNLNNQSGNVMCCNIAVVGLKAGVGAVSVTDFFRGNSDNRGKDFSVALNQTEFHCLPLNSDKFVVLTHKRFKLAATDNAPSSNQISQWKDLQFYIPIKRQLRYTSDTGTSGISTVHMMYWFDNFQTNAGITAAANQVNIQRKWIAYFREPKN